MTRKEFLEIKNMLSVYRGLFADEGSIESWYESLKKYDFSLIEAAVKECIKTYQYTPNPAVIIGLIPKPRNSDRYSPKYETINGKTQQVVRCRRCNDTGIRTWEDNERRLFGKPCDCQAGHTNYRWGWLTEEEQRDYVRRNGNHGEIIGESWYEN